MPTENNITLNPSQVYFNSPDGLQPLGDLVQEVTITEEQPELDILGDTPRYIVPQTGNFTADVLLTPEGQKVLYNMAQVIRTVWDVVSRVVDLWQLYPNKRVKHLALYAKPRIRKKNMRRVAREMLKEVQRRDRTRTAAP